MLICGSKILFLFSLFTFVATLAIAAPRIECDESVYDFGTVSDQTTITHEFTIWNRGDTVLNITKVRACCGMKASIDSMTIAPGTNAVCRAVFNLANRNGEQNKSVYLACDDPQTPYLGLKLTGTCRGAIDISPAKINFGSVIAGQEKVIDLTATNLLEETVTLDSVSSSARGVNAKIIQSGERDWKIQITAVPLAKAGELSGTVQLHFSSGVERIRVSGTVGTIITAIPDRIELAVGGITPVRRLVMLKSQDAQAFDILSTKLLNVEGTVEPQRISDNRWQCSLLILPSSLKSGASLRITTTCPDQPAISVPLNLR